MRGFRGDFGKTGEGGAGKAATSQSLLQARVVGILLFEFGQQYLHVLQLTGFFPILDQQHPCAAVGRVTTQDLFELLLRRFHLLQVVQVGGQYITVVVVVRRQFHRPREGEQGVFILVMGHQPQAQLLLQQG